MSLERFFHHRGEHMTPRARANRSVFEAIKQLLEQFQSFRMRDIERISTYSAPTVRRAIRELEQDGYIAVDRSQWKANPKSPFSYTILKEFEEPEQNNHPNCSSSPGD